MGKPMNIFGIELTELSWLAAGIMLVIGALDYALVNRALVQGELQAQREGTMSAEKVQKFKLTRTLLAIASFLGFPLVGLLIGDSWLGALF